MCILNGGRLDFGGGGLKCATGTAGLLFHLAKKCRFTRSVISCLDTALKGLQTKNRKREACTSSVKREHFRFFRFGRDFCRSKTEILGRRCTRDVESVVRRMSLMTDQ